MKTNLQFFDFATGAPSDCGVVLEIEFSSAGLDWPRIILEQGSSPHFYPNKVYTPYFYFALAQDADLHWNAATAEGMTALKTTPGAIWINPPKTPFSHDISEPCYFVILAINEQELLESCTLNLKGKELRFLNNYNVHDATIRGIIDLFMLEAKSGGRNGYAYLKNLLSLLATHYILHYSNYSDLNSANSNPSKFDRKQVDKIDRYIDKNISGHITVEDLADLLHCSKFYFLREFKKLMGITPYQYLLDKRLDQAKLLLNTTPGNIAAVGWELGFNDQAHFTRAFKKRFGITPGQFQRQSTADSGEQ